MKAFAVTARHRVAVAPDIPSVDEAGLPGLYFSLWAGLFAPEGTPKNIIDKLNSAAVDTLSDPNMRHKLTAQGFEIPSHKQQTPEALDAYQKAEIEKWWPIIRAAGIKAEKRVASRAAKQGTLAKPIRRRRRRRDTHFRVTVG